MALRTVRLDPETEDALEEVRRATGLPISEALKRGVRALRDQVQRGAGRLPADIYRELDLGPGGHARASSSDVKRAVHRVLKKKLHR